jgi:hypothetical protein
MTPWKSVCDPSLITGVQLLARIRRLDQGRNALTGTSAQRPHKRPPPPIRVHQHPFYCGERDPAARTPIELHGILHEEGEDRGGRLGLRAAQVGSESAAHGVCPLLCAIARAMSPWFPPPCWTTRRVHCAARPMGVPAEVHDQHVRSGFDTLGSFTAAAQPVQHRGRRLLGGENGIDVPAPAPARSRAPRE